MISLMQFIELAGAIGTFGLALVAFWNIFKPLKPKIIISYGTTGEYLSQLEDSCSSPPVGGESCQYYIFRLKVENRKKFTSLYAKKLYLRFMEISKLDQNGKWERLVPFNPFMLRWTSTTMQNDLFYNDLGKGEYLYANFFTIKSFFAPMDNKTIVKSEMFPGHEGIRDIALPAGFPRKKLNEGGSFKFKIGVFGENMKGKEFNYKVTFEASQNKDQPKIDIREM